MQKLKDHVDLVTDGDRKFFLRRPERQHRVRISHPAEIEQLRIVSGEPMKVPAGCRHFTVIRNVVTGARVRLLVTYHADAETDLYEQEAREIWELVESADVRDFVADLGKIMATVVRS